MIDQTRFVKTHRGVHTRARVGSRRRGGAHAHVPRGSQASRSGGLGWLRFSGATGRAGLGEVAPGQTRPCDTAVLTAVVHRQGVHSRVDADGRSAGRLSAGVRRIHT